jgi:hypothetical protein
MPEIKMFDLYTVDGNIRRFETLLRSNITPKLRRSVARRLDAERDWLAGCNAGAVDPSRLFHGSCRSLDG